MRGCLNSVRRGQVLHSAETGTVDYHARDLRNGERLRQVCSLISLGHETEAL
jgi:hypothetical protein